LLVGDAISLAFISIYTILSAGHSAVYIFLTNPPVGSWWDRRGHRLSELSRNFRLSYNPRRFWNGPCISL